MQLVSCNDTHVRLAYVIFVLTCETSDLPPTFFLLLRGLRHSVGLRQASDVKRDPAKQKRGTAKSAESKN
jgi:hypothetical protein